LARLQTGRLTMAVTWPRHVSARRVEAGVRYSNAGLWAKSHQRMVGRRKMRTPFFAWRPSPHPQPGRGKRRGRQTYKPRSDGRQFLGKFLSGLCPPSVIVLRSRCFALVIVLPGLAASLSQTCRSLSASCRQLVFLLDCIPLAPLREDV
jgi:hypothetical protein